MADLFNPNVALIALSVVERPEGEVYLWSFKIGTVTRYVQYPLSNFKGYRANVCQLTFYDVLESFYDEGVCPAAIYLYRLTDFMSTTQKMMDDEILGVERAIQNFYIFRDQPLPVKTIISVTEGPYEWSDFAVAAGNAVGDSDISYWVLKWPTGNMNIAYIKKLTLAHSFSSGFLRLAWKAKNYFEMHRIARDQEDIISGPNIGNVHYQATSLLATINFFLYGP